MTDQLQTATHVAHVNFAQTRKSVEVAQAAMKRSDELKQQFSQRLQEYAVVFNEQKKRLEAVTAERDGIRSDYSKLQGQYKKALEQIRDLTAEVQNLETNMQMFSRELMTSDNFLLDTENLLASVLDADAGNEKQIKPPFDLDLSQALSVYSKTPDVDVVHAVAPAAADDQSDAHVPADEHEASADVDLSDIDLELDVNFDIQAIDAELSSINEVSDHAEDKAA